MYDISLFLVLTMNLKLQQKEGVRDINQPIFYADVKMVEEVEKEKEMVRIEVARLKEELEDERRNLKQEADKLVEREVDKERRKAKLEADKLKVEVEEEKRKVKLEANKLKEEVEEEKRNVNLKAEERVKEEVEKERRKVKLEVDKLKEEVEEEKRNINLKANKLVKEEVEKMRRKMKLEVDKLVKEEVAKQQGSNQQWPQQQGGTLQWPQKQDRIPQLAQQQGGHLWCPQLQGRIPPIRQQPAGKNRSPVSGFTRVQQTHDTQQVQGPSSGALKCCPICLDTISDPVVLQKCKHTFCRKCIEASFAKTKPTCPVCGEVYGKITGNQPDGLMGVWTEQESLPGYGGSRTIVIDYNIPNGVQGVSMIKSPLC